MPVVFENMVTLEIVKLHFVKYGFYMRLCCVVSFSQQREC